MGDDTQCFISGFNLNSIIGTTNIRTLPNFNAKCLSKIKPAIYCFSKKTNTKITLLSNNEKLYTPDRYLSLENVNYAVLTDNTGSKLVAYGSTPVCFQGSFKYNIQSYPTSTKSSSSQVTLFDAVADAPIEMKYLEFYFSLSEDISKPMITTLSAFQFVAYLKLNNMRWSTLWDEKPNAKFHLIQDDKAESLLSLPPFGRDYANKERKITFETMELFIGSRSRFWSTYFEVKGLTIIEFLRTVTPLKLGIMADVFETYHLQNLFDNDQVSPIIGAKTIR